MRGAVKRGVLMAVAATMRHAGSRRSAQEVWVFPPADAGSIGDQALMQGVQDAEMGPVRQLVLSGWSPQRLRSPDVSALALGRRGAQARFLLSSGRCKCLYALGADVIDGVYSAGLVEAMVETCNLAVSAGVPAGVVGFSFSKRPNERAVAALRALSQGVVTVARDPVSMERFAKHVDRQVVLGADIAFLLRPSIEASSARQASVWAAERRASGRRLVGVNANVLAARGDVEALVELVCRVLIDCGRRNEKIDFLMVPHDFRAHQRDEEVVARIGSQVAGVLGPERTFVLQGPVAAWDIKGLVGELDAVLSGRMHLAIASFGQKVPAVAIGYQDKFEGLMELFATPELLVDHAAPPERIVAKLESVLTDRESYAQRIGEALPRVIELARSALGRVVAHRS